MAHLAHVGLEPLLGPDPGLADAHELGLGRRCRRRHHDRRERPDLLFCFCFTAPLREQQQREIVVPAAPNSDTTADCKKLPSASDECTSEEHTDPHKHRSACGGGC